MENGISTSTIRSWKKAPLCADVSGNAFPFPSKTKNNFRGIDISQPMPSMSLSVPSFSLDFSTDRVFVQCDKSENTQLSILMNYNLNSSA